MKDRIEYIDLAKGICILLVVLNHISIGGYFWNGNYPLNEVFDQMRMPLYFILSGLFFKDYQGGIREFCLRKTNRILVPYIFFMVVYRVAAIALGYFTGIDTTAPNVTGIWDPLWFLRCLFMMNIIFAVIYYAVRRIPTSPIIIEVLLGAIVFALGIVGYHLGNLHLNFGTVLTSLPFLWLGYFLNRKLHLLQMKILWWQALALAVLLFVMVHFLYMGENLFYNNSYSSPAPLLYFAGFAGTLAVLLVSSVVKWLPVVSYVGRYSIIVLCTHVVTMKVVIALLKLLPGGWDDVSLIPSLIVFALTTIGSVCCCWFLSKYLPWFTAQKDLIKTTRC